MSEKEIVKTLENLMIILEEDLISTKNSKENIEALTIAIDIIKSKNIVGNLKINNENFIIIK